MSASDTTEKPAQSFGLAIAWMLAWVASLSIMAISGRELFSDGVSTYQILFYRSAIGLTLVLIVWLFIGRPSLATKRLPVHMARNVIHYVAQGLWFLAIGLLPLAQVISIEFTVPVWTAILAALFLGERLTRARILAVALGFLGVLIIVRPGIEAVNLATAAIVVAAIGFAVIMIMTKSLAGTDSAFTLIFYMHLMQLIFGVVLLTGVTPVSFDWVSTTREIAPWAAAVGIAGFTSHYCLTRAMAVADATVVVPLDFLRLPVMMLVGYLLYQEQVDLAVFVGASMILAGNLLNVRAEGRKAHIRPR